MEARKVTVIQNKGNKVVIMSAATTLGQLKSDLREHNVDMTDMTFYEGVSRTTFIDDASVLPTNIPYKGNVTNELVIMLTLTNKKIKSGALSRSEAYAKVKEIIAANPAAKDVFNEGKNYTTKSTADLETIIAKYDKKSAKATPVAKPVATKAAPIKSNPSSPATPVVAPAPVVAAPVASVAQTPVTPVVPVVTPTVVVEDASLKAAFVKLLEVLEENDSIDDEEKEEILEILNGGITTPVVSKPVSPAAPYVAPKLESSFDDNELAEMMKMTR